MKKVDTRFAKVILLSLRKDRNMAENGRHVDVDIAEHFHVNRNSVQGGSPQLAMAGEISY